MLTQVRPRDRLLNSLSKESKDANYAFIAVAFVKKTPLVSLLKRLRRTLNKSARIDFFTSGYLDFTEPSALEYLRSQKRRGVKPYFKSYGKFHAKFLYFEKPREGYTLFLGSSNISESGLLEAGELNIEVNGKQNNRDQVYKGIQIVMEKIREDKEFEPITTLLIDTYRKRFETSGTRKIEHDKPPREIQPRIPYVKRGERWPIQNWDEEYTGEEEKRINNKRPEWRKYQAIGYSRNLSAIRKKGKGYFLTARIFKTRPPHFRIARFIDEDWIDKDLERVVWYESGKSAHLKKLADVLNRKPEDIKRRGFLTEKEIRVLTTRFKRLFPKVG